MDGGNRHLSILATCLAFITVTVVFLVLVKSGYRQQRRIQEHRDALARLVEGLEAKRQSYEKEREGLKNDPVFVEREARRLLGYMRPGEKVIETPPPTSPPKPTAGAPYKQVQPPLLQRVRGWVGTWQMTLAVILVILVALAVGLGFGGGWRTTRPLTSEPFLQLPVEPPPPPSRIPKRSAEPLPGSAPKPPADAPPQRGDSNP